MRLPLIAAAVAAAAGLAACTPARAPWTAPGESRAEVESAWEDCKRIARQRVAPQVERDMAGAPESRFPRSNPLDEADRRAAADTARQTVDSCMRAKGYSPAR